MKQRIWMKVAKKEERKKIESWFQQTDFGAKENNERGP